MNKIVNNNDLDIDALDRWYEQELINEQLINNYINNEIQEQVSNSYINNEIEEEYMNNWMIKSKKIINDIYVDMINTEISNSCNKLKFTSIKF